MGVEGTDLERYKKIVAKGNYLLLEIMRFSHEIIKEYGVNYYNSFKKEKFSSKEISMAIEYQTPKITNNSNVIDLMPL